MTDEEALRAAVLARPDDDTPRLVYADWCDDAGNPDRAEFIREQVAAARAEPFGPAARAARERAETLHAAHRWDWYDHLAGHVQQADFGDYARGFLHTATVRADGFPGSFAAACAAEPVRGLRLLRAFPPYADEPAPLEPVFASPLLARVETLDLADGVLSGTWEYDELAACPHLAGVRALALRGSPVPPDWLGGFLAGPAFPHLARLDLGRIPNVGPALAAALDRAAHRRLAAIDLFEVRLLSGELKRVLSSPALAGVEELNLAWAFDGPGPLTLLDIGWVLPWAGLRVLDLAGQRIGADGVKEIARKREAAGLRRLGLAGNQIGPAGARYLLDAPHLRPYHLDVADNGLTPRDLAALRARFPDAVVVG